MCASPVPSCTTFIGKARLSLELVVTCLGRACVSEARQDLPSATNALWVQGLRLYRSLDCLTGTSADGGDRVSRAPAYLVVAFLARVSPEAVDGRLRTQ